MKRIAIVCGRPEIPSHPRIVIRNLVYGNGLDCWHDDSARPVNRTAERVAWDEWFSDPADQRAGKRVLICPVCSLNGQRSRVEFDGMLDKLADNGVSEVSLRTLVSIFTTSFGSPNSTRERRPLE